MHNHINKLTRELKRLRDKSAEQDAFSSAYNSICKHIGIGERDNGRNRFTHFEQGQLSGAYHGFMNSLDTVFAYEYEGRLYTTHCRPPLNMGTTSTLHQLGLTQEQWGALPQGLYYRTGHLYFRTNEEL